MHSFIGGIPSWGNIV